VNRALRLTRPVLPFVLAAALLAGLVARVDAGETWREMKEARPEWIPVILAANYTADLFRAVRWRHLLSPVGKAGTFLLFAASQVGSAVNLVAPLRPGEAVRIRVVSRRSGIEPASIVGTWFGEVLSDIITFSSYVAIGLLLLREARFLWPVGALLGVVLVAGTGGAFWVSGRADSLAHSAELGRPGLRARINRQLYHFASGLASVRDPSVALNVLWSAQATWIAETAAFYACGRALDLDLSLGGYLLLVVVANIAGSLPLTQAGIGVFEVTVTGLMVAFGVRDAQAAAYAIFVHAFLTLPHVVSGPVAAVALRMRPSDVFLGGGEPET
jgi:uncharacterized protein (TIRG00374 family)